MYLLLMVMGFIKNPHVCACMCVSVHRCAHLCSGAKVCTHVQARG